jgi:hypothetical protein
MAIKDKIEDSDTKDDYDKDSDPTPRNTAKTEESCS